MKAKLFIICSWLMVCQFSTGQDCPTGDVTLPNQAAVDAFVDMYPDCVELPGQLGISGVNITNLNGLRNIKKLNGPLFVSGCHSLKDFSGLDSLQEINDWVRIQTNDSLESFKGLENLKIIRGEYMYLSNLGGMVTLDGFSSLDTMLGNIQIFQMPVLEQIDAFHNLRVAGDRIMVYQNPVLKEILGFDSLTQVEDLRIDDNDELESISAFDRIFDIRAWIVIRNNPKLSECSIESICHHLNNSDVSKAFNGNAEGCLSLSQVSSGCIQTSISEPHPVSYNIMPNPTYGDIFLEKDNMRLEWPDTTIVYGMDGRTHKVSSTKGSLQVSSLPAGIYIGQSIVKGELIQFTFVKL